MTYTIPCNNLDDAIEEHKLLGYRLDMIFPSDAPREALLSEPPAVAGGLMPQPTPPIERRFVRLILSSENIQPPAIPTRRDSDWHTGRAGMEYRDLLPDRMDGKVIASHIRLTTGGEVPDYVHYHKVEFQMIYCKKGRIKVVYEDQGEPFWLETGDCVLQPPEIRHRVLECTAGAEVIEVSMPAEHETWVEHEMTLPTAQMVPDRDFGGQPFVRHIAADSPPIVGEYGDFEAHQTEISAATGGFADVFELRSHHDHSTATRAAEQRSLLFYFVLSGRLTMTSAHFGEHKFNASDSTVVPPNIEYELTAPANTKILCVII